MFSCSRGAKGIKQMVRVRQRYRALLVFLVAFVHLTFCSVPVAMIFFKYKYLG